MARNLTRCALGVLMCAAFASPAAAQISFKPQPVQQHTGPAAVVRQGDLQGVVLDEAGKPVPGTVVSALGSSSAFAICDRNGRFTIKGLPAGPYLVRAHLQGYLPSFGRIIQVNPESRTTWTIALTRRAESPAEEPNVLAAGIGPGEPAATPPPDEHQHDEVAWRMRHLKRSVLKDAEDAVAEIGNDESLLADSFSGLTRAVGNSARLASALFADLTLNGEINLLTTTSFNRPQDLFSMDSGDARGIAYLALEAPGANGDWIFRGTITQGDLASWILAGSYTRHAPATHQYETGVSYGMQRYLGGNSDALVAMRDGSRNVGAIYAFDTWTVNPRVQFGYGAKFASYDYLTDRGLLSPRMTVTVEPSALDRTKLRTTFVHREMAPGAEEFLPPTVGLWLPPERTFSHLSRDVFQPERMNHIEIAAERDVPGSFMFGLRFFRQRVEDQVVTMFGVAMAEAPVRIGHYHVASAGAFEAHGWGVSVSRHVNDHFTASLDYTQAVAGWRQDSPDAEAIESVTASVLRVGERIHDLTATVQSILPVTATRIVMLYKLNSAFASDDEAALPGANARFDLKVNQAMPFMNFTNTRWEMLLAVSNLFHEELFDGSVYDELLVVRPPKRVLGGVTVRF